MSRSRSYLALIMVLLGVVLIGLAVYWILNTGDGTEQTVLQPTLVENDIPYPEIPRVSLEEARAAYEAQEAIFVDVRGPEYYDQAHIPNAVSMPENELSARMVELDPSKWIITYCT